MDNRLMRELADELVEGMRQQLPRVLEHDDSIWSVSVIGSYARGDFIGGNSDLDLNIILKPTEPPSPHYDLNQEPGLKAIQDLVRSILNGRVLYSHAFDWQSRIFHDEDADGIELMAFLWGWVPKRPEDIMPPQEGAFCPYFSIFMFDYIENHLVIWGNDTREIMPEAPDPITMVADLFRVMPAKHNRYVREGQEYRIPFGVFKAIQAAQIVFGERTLDKRRLLELYKRNVPDFPMKDFGCRVITDKMEQRFPDALPNFAPTQQYLTFVDHLATVVEAAL